MAQLDTPGTFVNGQIVNAATLNNIIGQAFALNGLIFDQAVENNPASNDSVLFYDSSAGGTNKLRRCLISDLPTGVTSFSMTAVPGAIFNLSVATPTTTPNAALSLATQTPNTLLAGPSIGVAGAVPVFRKLAARDLVVDTVDIAASAIDWSLGVIFKKTLTGTTNTNFTFTNAREGQRVTVLLGRDGTSTGTVSWPVCRWPAGVEHVMTTEPVPMIYLSSCLLADSTGELTIKT